MILDGHYWAESVDGELYIVYLDEDEWFTIGHEGPIDFDTADLVCPVPGPPKIFNLKAKSLRDC